MTKHHPNYECNKIPTRQKINSNLELIVTYTYLEAISASFGEDEQE
jgi:hypothetical protein